MDILLLSECKPPPEFTPEVKKPPPKSTGLGGWGCATGGSGFNSESLDAPPTQSSAPVEKSTGVFSFWKQVADVVAGWCWVRLSLQDAALRLGGLQAGVVG